MKQKIEKNAQVPSEFAGRRLDQVASELFPEYSRSLLQNWIKDGLLRVNGEVAKVRTKIVGGEILAIEAEMENYDEWQGEDIHLDIIYEDAFILVINKPAGLVVHPAAGNRSGTLLNALVFHHQGQSLLPRAGIVHRLDKDTSGLMVVAKTLEAHTHLVRQLQEKSITRVYLAIVFGEMTGGRSIDLPMGRHAMMRTKMAVKENGKEAITHIRMLQKFRKFTYVSAQLETGRTHQIRVHMSHIGFPLVGDPVYGGRKIPAASTEVLRAAVKDFPRQALHATRLGLIHPDSDEYLEWEQAAPEDFQQLLAVLQKEAAL